MDVAELRLSADGEGERSEDVKIIVELTKEELEKSGFTDIADLKANIIDDLDDAREYPGFNVEVRLVDKEMNA